MELKKRDLLIVYGALAAAGMFLVFKVILGPFHDKLVNLNKQVIVQEARLKKGIGMIEKKAVIDTEYGKYASYFSLQDFSNEESVANFLKEIERISREAGFVILDMKPQKEVEEDQISKQFVINVKAEADMRELTNFLYALYNSTLLFSVEKMVLVPKSEESSVLNITMTIAGVSFL